jgi:uncharacterized protein HemX
MNKKSGKAKQNLACTGKGFVFSFEAVISALILGLALIATSQQQTISLKEVLLLQQENDLLKVWSAEEKFPSEAEMVADANLFFRENCDLTVNGMEILTSKGKGKNCVSSEGKILDDSLSEKNILIKVYFE